MKNFTVVMLRPFVLMLFFVTVLPFSLVAQKKKTVKVPDTGYGSASYPDVHKGQYMKGWLLAGPFPVKNNPSEIPDAQTQEAFFQQDIISQVTVTPGKPLPPIQLAGKAVAWIPHTAKENAIDLDAIFNKADYAAAYAVAEINAASPYTAFLAIGSDDGVKVWHNGKLVHKNWIGRAITPDEDLIAVDLVQGSNQFVIKVQDIVRGWGFTARLLDKDALSDRLITAAGRGNIDDVNAMLKAGADPGRKNSEGLTAADAARLHGREEILTLLLQKGATKGQLPAPEVLIDGLYQSLNGQAAPGIAVLVAKDGKILYKKGFGYADIESKTLVSADTKFRIGSITKQFTASAILKLQEEGRLQVTDKLSKYIPDFPRGGEVTLHHLLTHTSGIHSYTGKEDFLKRVLTSVTNEELLTYFKSDPYDFNPGDQYRYNNSGYFLLGYIIEKVTGKSYGQHLKETFFDPLNMTNTGVHASTLTLTNEAKGYTKEGTYTRSLNWDMSWAGGAGALYSTVEDLYRWNEAVFNGKVLSEKSLKAAFTPLVLNNGTTPSEGNYGYGWVFANYRGQEIIQHGGGLHGFISQLSRFPEENLTVVMLTNVTPPQVNINANTLAEFYLWEKMDKQPSYSTLAASNADLKIYEGRYDFKNGAVMTITTDGKDLYAQLSNQPKFQIFPSAPDEYFWKVVEAKIKFFKNEKNEVTHGHFVQGGFEIDAVRLKEEVIVSVDPAIFKDYTGKYDYGSGIVITITAENEKLFAQATNQAKVEIFPLSEKEFMLKDLNAKVVFPREANGKVSKLMLDMGGSKRDLPRIE
jgi:CubicO group peptidase (beta-lactamase class C family)